MNLERVIFNFVILKLREGSIVLGKALLYYQLEFQAWNMVKEWAVLHCSVPLTTKQSLHFYGLKFLSFSFEFRSET